MATGVKVPRSDAKARFMGHLASVNVPDIGSHHNVDGLPETPNAGIAQFH